MYSEKVAKFCEISTVDLSHVVTVKSTVEISQNFVAFSEYMNFNQPFLQSCFKSYFKGILPIWVWGVILDPK